MDVNWLAVFLAALSAFVLGGLWYGPLFGKAWQGQMGLSDEQLKKGNMGLIFGGAFVLALLAAWFFAMFLGRDPGLGFATGVGFGSGLLWVSGTLGILYLFGRRPMKLWLIDAGYCTGQFTLFGAILGALG
ncbi:MAG: DUF1761 domain-containing protein [Erythrobacter sp.]|nr:DUF1761 domain-containing protein [Erythrobacter sp.]